MHQLQPHVGQWYLCRNIGQKFEVVSVDDGVIELQDEWGSMGEISAEGWFSVDLETSGPPKEYDEPDTTHSWSFHGTVDKFLHGKETDDVGSWDKGMEDASNEGEGPGATRAPV
jgi:hypothetical protein